MRILLTVHQFLPEFHAGTEILTYGTAKALQARGHEVLVVTGHPDARPTPSTPPSPRIERYIHGGISVERFSFDPLSGTDRPNLIALEYDNPAFADYFRDLVARVRPDMVHFFHLQRLSASAIDVCRDAQIPMVYAPTDFWPICATNQLLLPDESLCTGPDARGINCLRHFVSLTQSARTARCVNLIPDFLMSMLIGGAQAGLLMRGSRAKNMRAVLARPAHLRSRLNAVDRIAVPTRLMASLLVAQGVDPSLIASLPFGIDTGTTQTQRPPTEGRTPLRVGFIGTLSRHKGVHLLIDAVRNTPAAIPLSLKIYGSGSEYPAYVAQLRAAASDDDRISFCGTFANSDIGEVFAGLDVLVVPSIWYENTPLVIHSAQACACPVIASDLGGMSEVVHHEVNGLLFAAGNAAELARALQRLAADRDLLGNLSERATPPKPITTYASELEAMYDEIRSRRKAA